MQTRKHSEYLHIWLVHVKKGKKSEGEKARRKEEERKKFLRVFTEVHVIISKMFWQNSAEKTEKGMPNSLEPHQESSLELV